VSPPYSEGGLRPFFPFGGGRALRGLLCRRPPPGPIATNSLAPTSWKNPGPYGEDAISGCQSYHSSGVNSTASTGARQPFGFGCPAFGGNRRRVERSGGQAHRLGGVRGQPRGARGFGARHRGALKDPSSHRGQGCGGPARAGDGSSSSQAQPSQQHDAAPTHAAPDAVDFNIRQAENYLALLQSQIAGTTPPQ
jgi:hypothetical protein